MKKHFIFLVLVLLSSCDIIGNPIIDKDTGMRKKDIERALSSSKDKKDDSIVPPLQLNNLTEPQISRLLVPTPPPPMGNGKKISFSITEEVSIKDVLIELARLADIDIQIDPLINKGIILKVTNKPVHLVVDLIAELSDLRYEYSDGILKIDRDLPYTKHYDIDFLAEDDIWESIETSIEYLIEIYPTNKHTSQKRSSEGEEEAKEGGSSENSSKSDILESKISVNKPANIISIFTNNKAHRAITSYINQAKKNYSTQVLLEAKLVEVVLSDEFKAGINWNIGKDVITPGVNPGDEPTTERQNLINVIGGAAVSGGMDSSLSLKIGKGYDLNMIIGAMDVFGTTRTLSSPRVSAINNKTAKLEFTKKIVYFSMEVEEEDEDNGDKTKTYTTTKEEEDTGVTLEITPSINLETREITLEVVPELKVLTEWVRDPNPDVENQVPVIQTRKVETSLKIDSGEVMVIGGLMQETSTNSDGGVPILKDIPVVNWFFRNKSRKRELTETVIFIKATILERGNMLNKYDKDFYKNFSTDRNNFIE